MNITHVVVMIFSFEILSASQTKSETFRVVCMNVSVRECKYRSRDYLLVVGR